MYSSVYSGEAAVAHSLVRRFFFVALSILLLLPASVSAHALLLRSTPEANAALVQAPVQVELYFTETLEPSFSTVTVLDANGAQVDAGDARVDPADTTRLIISLRSLSDGVYTVSWKALSTVDGHITTGAFPFAVGDVDAAALAAAEQASRQIKLSVGEVVAKWMLYLAAAALTGGLLFRLLVWRPAYRTSQAEAGAVLIDTVPWRRGLGWALTVFFIANMLSLLVQAGQAAGGEISAPWADSTASVLFNTRFGALWAARLGVGVILVGLVLRARAPRTVWVAFGLSTGLLLTIALGSHAAAESQPWLPVINDWVHLLAASMWVGGLIAFVIGLWFTRSLAPPARTALVARLLPRFSALALISVGTLTLTGLNAGALLVGELANLTTTLYGQTLLVKLGIAVVMAGMGAVHLLWITPRLKRAAWQKQASPLVLFFRRLVTSESGLGVILLLTVGVLTAIPPARIPVPTLQETATAEDVRFSIDIAPGRVGLNTFTLTLTANGQPLAGAKEVALRFTPTTVNVSPSEAQLVDEGNGVYALKGAFFSLPDVWQVQAVVRREGQFDAFANFNFDLRPVQANTFPWSRVTGGLVMAAALAGAFALNRLTRTQAQFFRYGLPVGVALFLAGLFIFYRPAPTPPAGRINPIAPNPDSVAIGQALYQTNCLPCHGLTGKGDGPVGLTLNPRPADLSQHAIPGVHTDGQLFEWISNGFPGSVMPAFKDVLSEDGRWHLINFMRDTLAPK